MIRFLLALVLVACLALVPRPASAHPHVFVTVNSTVEYAEARPKAVHHTWRFDDMFSSFAIQGLDADGDGKLSRDELAGLAQVNVDSLKEFDYFTFGKAGGKDTVFDPPTDYWLDYDGTALTLHFTLPVQTVDPAASNMFRVEIFDPTYFVAFTLAGGTPATLKGAPAGCRIDAETPPEEAPVDASGQLTEDFFSQLDANSGFGAQFSNALVTRCGAEAQAYVPPAKGAKAPPAVPADGSTTVDAGSLPEKTATSDQARSRVDQAQSIVEDQPLETAPASAEAASSSVTVQPAASSSALGAFGVVRPDGAASVASTGLLGWIARKQSDFYQVMSRALTASKTDGSALFLLAGLSFAYGIFHAAGPGHGKAVISSYLIATGETLRRGILISAAAALAQAITAVAVVGIMAGILGVTSQKMGVAAWWLEMCSYVLIAGVGLNLILRRGRSLLAGLRGDVVPHDHDCGDGCGHSHAPGPETLVGQFSWRRAGSAVLAIGLRPCTGALLILVFAMAQGMVWAGVAATFAMAVGTAITVSAIAILSVSAKSVALRLASGMSGGVSRVAGQGVEVLAGVVVLLFGLTLLGGLLSTGVPVG
jgi:ABC-type nickel/cobalt efflux system permease component RcnA/ABC-type uncharacterized transport system substrate-binding protein